MAEPVFQCADAFMVRAPLRALPIAETGSDRARDGLATAVGDSLLTEAVAVASPSLASVVEKVARQGTSAVSPKDLRRMESALDRYRTRLATRSTPFGLFAGVGIGGFGSAAQGRIGTGHVTHTRPDAGWLMMVVRRLESDLDILRTLRIKAADTWRRRGERLVLTDRQSCTEGTRPVETSIRFTAPVSDVLLAAGAPIAFEQLLADVGARYPRTDRSVLEGFLRDLVEQGFLLTELCPPLSAPSPLEHILDVLARTPADATHAALRQIRDAIDDYDRLPVGHGAEAFRTASSLMRDLQPAEHVLQVDVELDLSVTLPRSVAVDLSLAAEHLRRLSPPAVGTSALRSYHLRFLENYGTARTVPLLDLVSDATGLGLPDEYLSADAGADGAVSSGAALRTAQDERRRVSVLSDLVDEAIRSNSAEIVLDDRLVRRLAPSDESGEAPRSLELFATVVAANTAALDAGDYRVLLGPLGPSQRAGAAFGRFSHVLGKSVDQIADVVRAIPGPHAGAVRAALNYRPVTARWGNVGGAPDWLGRRIQVGDASFAPDPRDLRLSDLAVRADNDRLHLVEKATGREVVPVALNLVNTHILASGVARFLHDLGQEGVRPVRAWDWGTLQDLPFLPRVRSGRVVLAPATWRLPQDLVDQASEGVPEEEWLSAVDRWRASSTVPSQVAVAASDVWTLIRLDDRDQLRVLRRELRRNPLLRLQEPRNGDAVQNWLVGPDGQYSNEIVVPMIRRAGGETETGRVEAGAERRPPHPRPATPSPGIHLPGGEWLFAKIYGPVAAQQEVLGKRLGPLVAEAERLGVGTWFYIRYADPRAHLRLRFHGEREALWHHLLPVVHSWAEDLRSVGLAGAVELSTYEPETERYGGPEILDAAERAFTGDSRTAVELLAVATSGPRDLAAVTAASVIDLLDAFGGRTALAEWQAAGGPRGNRLPAGYTREDGKATAAFAFEAVHGSSRSIGSTLAAAWDLRRSAVRDYGRRVAEFDATGAGRHRVADIGASLVHMHCNRVLGVDRAREADVLALARAAVRDRLGRERHAESVAVGAVGAVGATTVGRQRVDAH